MSIDELKAHEHPFLSFVSLSDPQYDVVDAMIRATYPNCCIVWIQKINNPKLTELFDECERTVQPPNVKRLFHGTSESSAMKIIENGFDAAYNRTSAHGLGTYFATTARYSSNYMHHSSGREYVYMMVADVVTGKSTKGVANKPIPPKFDCVVDNPKRPSMYIVNKTAAAIPRYLCAFYKSV